jgi:hypothetical protein
MQKSFLNSEYEKCEESRAVTMTAAQYKRVQVRNERRPGRDMETS